MPRKAKVSATSSSGKGLAEALVKMGYMALSSDYSPVRVRRCLHTGLLALDVVCARDENGIFGLPFGRQIEISGLPDAGKTSLLFEISASAQRLGHKIAWSESELEINEERARQIGCNPDEMMIDFPKYLELSLTKMRQAIELLPDYESPEYEGSSGLICPYDSVGAICTKDEFIAKMKGDEEEENSQPALFAKKMAQWQRRFKKILVRRDAIVIFANHLIEKINSFGKGKKRQTRGGNALRYHCAIRLEAIYTGKLLDGSGNPIGTTVDIEVVKNKYGSPFQKIKGLNFVFGQGFDKDQQLLMALEMRGLCKKEGFKYAIQGLPEPLTMQTLRKQLLEHPEMRDALTQSVYES